MAQIDPVGRPRPLLLTLLWGSFILMILSGVFFALGLPEEWARGLFVATVIVWVVLGIALIVQGQMEVKAFRKAGGTPRKEGKGGATDMGGNDGDDS
jgi:hypothetical protein